MNLTIKSRKLGHAMTYFGHNGYIWVDINGEPGTLGKQLCYGGKFRGNTVMYNNWRSESAEADFKKEARAWHRAFIKDAIEW